jgi:hypothetical protein
MLRQFVQSAILRCGYNLRRRVATDRVAALLARLQPVETRFALVRLGGDGDGGYLVPDDLGELDACFSPGVDRTASFEADIVERGIRCFLADASVDGPPVTHPLIEFDKKFLGVVNDSETTTLDAWVEDKLGGTASNDLLLQMDIEGHEWAVLLNASDAVLQRFRIIVLELHGLPHSFDDMTFNLFNACIDRLGRIFHVVHAHPNNAAKALHFDRMTIPYLLEITLLRRDRAEALRSAQTFPHPLDRPNLAGLADLLLPASLIGKP